MLLVSCAEDSWQVDVSSNHKNIEVKRFDRDFFSETDDFLSHFRALEKNYPVFFSEGKPPIFWEEVYTDPQMRELYELSENVFGDLEETTEEIEDVWAHVNHYFPDIQVPTTYAYISGIDPEFPVIYADTLMFLGLDNYLGENFEGYGFLHAYLRPQRAKPYLKVDVAERIAESVLGPCNDCQTLLDAMIHKGKLMIALDAFMPDVPDSLKVKFSSTELEWCKDNAFGMWRYLIENDLLYDTSFKNKQRFLEPAPFTKFYTGIDKASPGQAGKWIGWEIVRAYHQETGADLNQILTTPAKTILAESNYKPKR